MQLFSSSLTISSLPASIFNVCFLNLWSTCILGLNYVLLRSSILTSVNKRTCIWGFILEINSIVVKMKHQLYVAGPRVLLLGKHCIVLSQASGCCIGSDRFGHSEYHWSMPWQLLFTVVLLLPTPPTLYYGRSCAPREAFSVWKVHN